jgi:hypothetical protein
MGKSTARLLAPCRDGCTIASGQSPAVAAGANAGVMVRDNRNISPRIRATSLTGVSPPGNTT